ADGIRDIAVTGVQTCALPICVVALTLSPMMSSKLLKPPEQQTRLAKRIDAGFERLKHLYGRVLSGMLGRRRWVYAGWGFLSVLAIGRAPCRGGGPAPPGQRGL